MEKIFDTQFGQISVTLNLAEGVGDQAHDVDIEGRMTHANEDGLMVNGLVVYMFQTYCKTDGHIVCTAQHVGEMWPETVPSVSTAADIRAKLYHLGLELITNVMNDKELIYGPSGLLVEAARRRYVEALVQREELLCKLGEAEAFVATTNADNISAILDSENYASTGREWCLVKRHQK